MIKMYDLKAQYNQIKDKIDNSVQSVLNDSAFSSGKYIEKWSFWLDLKICYRTVLEMVFLKSRGY